MIKIFSGEGVVDREGCSSERCLKWDGGGGGHKGIFPKTSQNRGWVKAKVVRRGEGVLKVSPPLPPSPPENFNHTLFIPVEVISDGRERLQHRKGKKVKGQVHPPAKLSSYKRAKK